MNCRQITMMHNSISQLTSLSACSRRQRKRKLTKPQKRQQHFDSREDEQETVPGMCEETYSLRHKLRQSPRVDSCETTDDSRETTEPRYLESERVACDTESRIDGIKKEPIHEFIVDQWYDLGPCPHKYAYSPGSPEPMGTEKIEMKDNTTDSCTENSWNNEAAESVKPKLANRTCQRVPSGHTFDPAKGMQVPVSTQVYPSPDRGSRSGSTEVAQGAEPYKVNDVAGPNGVRSMSILQPFLGCPLPTTGNSFILQQNHFPLSVHAATPYFHMAATVNPPAANNTSVTPSHNYSYMTNLSVAKPGVIHANTRPEAGFSNLNHLSQNYNIYSKTDRLMSTTPGMPCPLSLSSAPPNSTPFHRPAVASHFLAPKYARHEGAIEYGEFLYPNNLYQSNSFHSTGVVLVSSHPYYVEQMPFVPLIPEVYNHLHVDVPRCSPNTLAHSSRSIPQEADRNLTTPTGNSATSLLGTSNPMTTMAPLTETVKPGSTEEKRATDPGPTSQHPARVKVKPRIATSTDFIDPTRVKFGIDDVDTDEDLSKINDFSDCSDQEWQPSNRDLRISYRRERENGNGWTAKNDGFTELDSSVKKTHCRRRQRWSKEVAECNECGKVFKGRYYLRRHQMSHSDVRPFQCSTCHKCFKQKAHLIGHQSVHERALKLHAPDDQPPSPKSMSLALGSKCPGRPKKPYTEKDRACRECGKIFKTVYRLKRHELSHTDVRPFSCRICGKAFKQTGHRNEHEANHENTKRRFLCNMCGVVFRCRSSFNNHIRSHGMEKLRIQTARSDVGGTCADSKQETSEICHTGYDCPYCTEKFATAQALNSHLESHVEVQQRRHVQPYSCDVCRRAFTYRHNLIKHKLIHKAPDKFAQFYKEKFEAHVASGKPSFNCTKCPKVFIRKETLAKHCKIHTGSKPYKCAICSHQFTQNVHLKVHMRKHTGSRPFQCKECTRSFIDSTALAKHIEYEACNTDNSLYHCKLCDKMHYYLGSLKKHIRKRHGAKEEDVEKYIIKSERSSKRRGACEGEKHPCKVCSSSFSEKCNLVRHIKRKHGILVELLQKELEGKRFLDVVDECIASDAVSNDGDLNSDNKLAVAAPHPWLIRYRPESRVAAVCEAGVNSQDVASSGPPHVENLSCKDFNTPDVVASSQPEAAGNISTVSAETHEVPQPVLRSTATMEPVNSPERHSLIWERADNTNLSADNNEAKSPFKHQREENTDGVLKGFQNSEFECSEKQLGKLCTQKPFLCKKSCCSHVQANSCTPTETTSRQPGEFIPFANKCNSEVEPSLPTDIHFLYKIGLVVSSKGKVPGGPVIKQRCGTPEKEWNCNPFIPVCKSLTRLGFSSDDPKPHSYLYREEYHNQAPQLACCRSRSFSFLDDAYSDRGEAVTSTDDSCSLGFSNETKQGLNLNSSGSVCDKIITSGELYNIKHNLRVIETSASMTDHLGSEIEHRSSEIEHRSSEIEHRSSEIEHRSSEIEPRSSEIEHRCSEIEHRSSEIEPRSSEIEHRSSEIEHRCSEIEHRSSEIEPRSSEIEHRSSEREQHSSEVENYLSDITYSSKIKNNPSDVAHPHSEIEHHSSEIEHHSSEIEHHSSEIEHHSSEIEHHSSEVEYHLSDVKHRHIEVKDHTGEVGHSCIEAEYCDSEVEHPSEIEHRPTRVEEHRSEIEHHPTQVEHRSQLKHRSSEAEHRSQLKYRSSEAEHRSQLKYRSSEAEHRSQLKYRSSEAEHRSQLKCRSSEAEHRSQLKYRSSEAEHVNEIDLSPSKCEPNFQNTFNSYALESDKVLMVPSAAECNNQSRMSTDSKKLGVSDTAAVQQPDTGETAGVVAKRSNWARLNREGTHPQVNKSLGKTCLTASNFCTSSKHATKMTCGAQSSTSRQQEKDVGQQLLDLRHCATPGEGGSASPRISVLLQCDAERGKMCIISPDLGLNTKTSRLLAPKAGLCAVTVVEAVTSELGECPPVPISTRLPYLSLSDRTVETSGNDATCDDQIIQKGDVFFQQRESADACSLIHKAAEDKSLDSAKCLPFEDVSNSADPRVHSENTSRNFSSHMSAVDSSKNDYEACPTESHLQYLGLLACKDAQEVKNRSTPVEDLYQKYKPWLEELVRSTRPRKSRIGDKLLGAATRDRKNTASATTVAEQLTYMRHASFESTENIIQLMETSDCGTASFSMEAVDVQQTAASEPSVVTRRWPCVEKSMGEIQTDPEESLQTLAESGSQDSEVLLTSGHTSRSISPTVQQIVSTSTALPTSAAADTHNEALPCTMSATDTVSSRGVESVSACVDSSSPPSTPDSTAKGKQVYVCLVCNKYFTARHQLKRHAMTHTDHRPFTCDKCGRAFRQKVHLSDHTKRHQGQRPFVCAGCGKRFVLKNEMNQHIKNHCRGSLDVFRGVSLVSDKRVCPVATTECNPMPGAGEAVPQPTLQSPNCMLMIGQCYRAGDIISNGTITLKVIESAYNQPHTSVDSISIAPPLAATVGHKQQTSAPPETHVTAMQSTPLAMDSPRTRPRETT